MRAANPTTAQGISWTPPLAEVCFQSSPWGVSEPETVVQWNVWLCTCGLQTWSHSLSPIPLWHSLSAIDVSLWCPESVPKNRWPGMSLAIQEGSSLIFSPKHVTARTPPVGTPSSFVRECCPNSDSDSPVPEIFWHKNRQSASEANPVKVSDNAILPGCLIGFLQVKEETNYLLPLSKGIPEISFKAHQVVSRATMFSETTLASV